MARALVATQVVAVTILMFFGVMSGVVAYRVAHIEVGYDTHRLLNSSLEPARDRYPTREARTTFYKRSYDALAQSPALDGVLARANIASIDDAPAAAEAGTTNPRAYVQATLGPLATVGVSITNGRAFDDRDDQNGAPVAIVSAALARQYWPGRAPVGQRIRLAADSGVASYRTVVGVASDVLMGAPFARNRSANAVYIPLRQTDVPYSNVVFRYRSDIPAAQAELYAALASVDPRILPPDVQTYDEVLEKSSLIAASVTKLFAFCFGFALLLAVSGTYGLMARSIGQRAREIGIRRALGATDRGVMRLLLGQGGRQLGVGVLIALPVMAAVGFGFWRFFPLGPVVPVLSAVLVSATIVSIVLLATWIPTRRVLAISPRDAIWRD
jgi:ABC-type antimicrobial peptide transport system permease subunit